MPRTRCDLDWTFWEHAFFLQMLLASQTRRPSGSETICSEQIARNIKKNHIFTCWMNHAKFTILHRLTGASEPIRSTLQTVWSAFENSSCSF